MNEFEKFYICPVCKVDMRPKDENTDTVLFSYPTGMLSSLLLSLASGYTPERDDDGRCSYCGADEQEQALGGGE